MFENRMYRICREADLLKAADTLPELSPGLRSRVLAAAIEAQDRRAQGRRVLASALGLFAMLAGVAWLGPFSNNPFSNSPFTDASNIASDSAISGSSTNALVAREALTDVGVAGDGTSGDRAARDKTSGEKITDKKAASVLSSFSRGQGLMSMMGDDWRSVEDELRSRQEHFPRFQM